MTEHQIRVRTSEGWQDLIKAGPTGPSGPSGPSGPEGPPGGAMVTGWWDYNVATTAPPALKQIRTSPATTVVGQPMTIYLSATDNDGLVWSGTGVAVGDDLRLRGTAGAVQHCTVTAFTITAPGPTGYATIQTMVASSTGAIAKNAKVEVTLIHAPTAGPTGPAGPAGAAGAPGPAGADGNFRGEWVSDTIVKQYNFSTGIPAGFTTSVAGTGQAPVAGTVAEISGTTGAPVGYVNTIKMGMSGINAANRSDISLNLASLGIPNITKATAWFGTKTYSSAPENNLLGQIVVNGGVAANIKKPIPWTQLTASCDSDDILTLRSACDYGATFGVGTIYDVHLTALDIYATTSPYMLGHYVSYQGKLWRSLVNNNSATPAEGAYWTSVIYGGPVVVQHGTNGAMARPTYAAVVYWVGSATPANGLPYDFWKDT